MYFSTKFVLSKIKYQYLKFHNNLSNQRAKITYCTPSRLLWVEKRPFRTAGPDLEGLKSYGKSCLFFSMIFNIRPRNYFYTYLDISSKNILKIGFGILLPKLFWTTVRKKCSSDWEKLLKFKAEGREFLKNWDH